MNKSIQLVKVTLIALAFGISFPASVHAVNLPFCDGFETYADGTYPSPPWINLYSGRYAHVSTEQAYSGNQSFLLAGRSGWSRADAVNVSFPDSFTYSFAVMIAPDSAGGIVGIAKSFGGANPTNGVGFDPDGNRFGWDGPGPDSGSPLTLLNECIRSKWYHVSVTIKGFLGASPMADVTITCDGTSVTTTDIPAYNHSQLNRNLLQLHTFSRAETKMYFDDVCIAETPQIIGTCIDIDPDTLDLNSKDKWITCYIEPPEGYDACNIVIESILLENLLEVQHSDVQNGVLMVKFDRQDVIAYIELVLGIVPPDNVSLIVTGDLSDRTLFEGSDTIRVKKE